MKQIFNYKNATVADMEEIWVDYPRYPERYQVSSLGRVRSKSYLKVGRNEYKEFSFITKPRILQPFKNEQGYLQMRLQVDGYKFTERVHRMVAETFIPNPEGKDTVNHINSIRDDNRLSNLEWNTQQENIQHCYDSGNKTNKGEAHSRAILTEDIVRRARAMYKEGISVKKIASFFSVREDTISSAISGKNWGHVK